LGPRGLEMLQAPRYLNPALGLMRSGADLPLGYKCLSLGPPTSGAQNVGNKGNFQHFCKHYFCFGSTHVFLLCR